MGAWQNGRFQRPVKAQADQDWIFSYADMVSLLLGFFIILYSFSTLDDDKFKQLSKDLSKSLVGEKGKDGEIKNPVGMRNEQRQLRAMQILVSMLNIGSVDELVERVEKSATNEQSAKNLKAIFNARMTDESLDMKLGGAGDEPDKVVEFIIPSVALFDSGTARMLPQSRQKLEKLAANIVTIEGLVGVEIEGHTDSNTPSANSLYPDNWALSAARSGAVSRYLIEAGIAPEYISARGLANLKPMYPENTGDTQLDRQNRQKNRRVHIIIRKNKVTKLEQGK